MRIRDHFVSAKDVEYGILHAGKLETEKASSLSSWVCERLDSSHLNIKLLISTKDDWGDFAAVPVLVSELLFDFVGGKRISRIWCIMYNL